MQEVKKIVIIGPESTGKSTLCQQLAEHYNTLWCPEYAREYLEKNGPFYSYEDLLEIAKGQLRLEDEFLEKVRNAKYEVRSTKIDTKELGGMSEESGVGSREAVGNEETLNLTSQTTNYKLQTLNPKLLFIDTNMYVMKVWNEFVFEKCHQFILDEIVNRKYNVYLLCNIDLPWIKDELREYPDLESRQKLYHIYKDILVNQQVLWSVISGSNEERLKQATKVVDHFFI